MKALLTVTNTLDNMQATVCHNPKEKRQYKVSLKDLDGDALLPTVYSFKTHGEAVGKAYSLASVCPGCGKCVPDECDWCSDDYRRDGLKIR